MLLHHLVATSDQVASTRKRLEKISLLAALLDRVAGDQAERDQIDIAVAFLTGTLRQGRIGVGYAALKQAKPSTAAIEPRLTLHDVDRALTDISELSGPGSGRARVEALQGLLERGVEAEQRFLVRLLIGELRQGAVEGVLTEAVARATGIAGPRVRRAVMLTGDLGEVARAVLRDGAEALDRFSMQLFRPVQPMLAQPVDDVDAALEQIDSPLLDYKLDGARIQVHKDGDEVRVYSRQLREVTAAVPEVVELTRSLPAESLMFDGEVLALRQDGSPLPFQVTMRRFGRRLDVEAMRQELPLQPVLFDLLYLDGAELIDEPLSRRATVMDEIIAGSSVDGGSLQAGIPRLAGADAAAAQAFLERAIAEGHEGVMAKDPNSPYAAGSRGRAWLKIKPAHTLDLVILAAEWGSGRRKGWLSNLHLGARDPDNGGFVMLGKTFKGLTDALLTWQTEQLLAREIGRDRRTVHVRPELVAEIAFNEVQVSPRYPGGLALRFARVKRYRDDKTADQADTIATVREIHERVHRI